MGFEKQRLTINECGYYFNYAYEYNLDTKGTKLLPKISGKNHAVPSSHNKLLTKSVN